MTSWQHGDRENVSGTSCKSVFQGKTAIEKTEAARHAGQCFGCTPTNHGRSAGVTDSAGFAAIETAGREGMHVFFAVSTDGYEHNDSKSIAGGKFVGLACDEDNQPDMSEDRVKAWVGQIKGEGMPL